MSEEAGEPDAGARPSDAEQRDAVRERYADIADDGDGCCGTGDGGEAGAGDADDGGTEDRGIDGSGTDDRARAVGYADEDLDAAPAEANLGLGCGNPTALASLEAGDTVVDLGSGAGFDCFIAAEEVGEEGRVIGVDMTPEMVEKARANVRENEAENVEFRLGEIEHLPVADGTVDVVVSNCVVNLSPEKPRVFAEAFRVLRPGGRLAVSDVVLTAELPSEVRADRASVAGCVAGAARVAELESMLADAGFEDVTVEPKDDSEAFIREWDDERDLSDYVVAATIEGRKPDDG